MDVANQQKRPKAYIHIATYKHYWGCAVPLIKCPDCGADISDATPACPKCGRPIASIPSKENETSSKKTAITITVSSFVVAVLALFAAVWFIPTFQVGKNIETSCSISGFGGGSCQFTNTGWTPGSQCVVVKLSNQAGGSTASGPVCSGAVWPSDTRQRDVQISIGDVCNDADGTPDLKNACSMDIVDAEDGGSFASPTQSSATTETGLVSAKSAATVSSLAPAPSPKSEDIVANSSARTVARSSDAANVPNSKKGSVQQPFNWDVTYQDATCKVFTGVQGDDKYGNFVIAMGYPPANQLILMFSVENSKVFKGKHLPDSTKAWFVVDGSDFDTLGASVVGSQLVIPVKNSLELQHALATAKHLGFKLQLTPSSQPAMGGDYQIVNISGAMQWLQICSAIGIRALPNF